MTSYTIPMPCGDSATISWVRDAPWGQHWAVSLGNDEVARYATFTEARKVVERTAGRGLGGWSL